MQDMQKALTCRAIFYFISFVYQFTFFFFLFFFTHLHILKKANPPQLTCHFNLKV